jgi:hypothetical protein
MTPLETYLRELRDIRSFGAAVKETSYYPALSNLLNEVGKRLKPRIRCIINLANRGAGLPDGGLFTADQFQKPSEAEPLPGQPPARGVIEAKSTKDDAWTTADGEQVSRYWGKYRQVLVTNYRDFVLVGQDAEGKPAKLESFRLADNEKTFWAAAEHPRSLTEKIGARFEAYLLRVMRHAALLAAPEDVAWFLASYARDARARIEGVELPALATVRSALEEALGLKFEGEKGEHFFRSSLVQTLFYGVFSAWVLWAKQNPPSVAAVYDRRPESENDRRSQSAATAPRFNWYETARYLRVPMISKLFHLVADPQELEALKLTEVLDWATLVLNRVDRRSFFDRFQESHAVQYFYEPFLEAFDPELRKELGVWYTPPEIVKYMVERVDTVLRQELDLPLGLADKNVYVLDPCCGTGSYLVEVLDRIHRTLKERGEDALIASDLKEAAQKRVFGFEILPAPFVVAHLQLGLLLQNLGAPLSVAPLYERRPEKTPVTDRRYSAPERVGVYLTNALTGWEPPKAPKTKLLFPELEAERDLAEEVKREKPILVILGNPPYNAFAGVSPEEEQGLVEPYKEGLVKEWGIKKFNLDDLYTRFFRLAECRITEGKPGKGIVCFISNFSYLGDPSFVVMRKRFLTEFDSLWFDCMNGDSRETGKLTPEGKPDPSVFSTDLNREGIRVGTAVGLMVRSARPSNESTVRFRHFWGASKRHDLLASLEAPSLESQYQLAQPEERNRFSFRPSGVKADYLRWPTLPGLCAHEPFNGPIERRGNALIAFPGSDAQLEALQDYLDQTKDDAEIQALAPLLMRSSGEFKAEKTRVALKGKVKYDKKKIVNYPFKPFDLRLAYLDPEIQPLFSRPSPELLGQRFPGNEFMVVRETGVTDPTSPPLYFSRSVCDYHCLIVEAKHIPIRLLHLSTELSGDESAQGFLLAKIHGPTPQPVANLSLTARSYLSALGIVNPDPDVEAARLIWMHALAIAYSPAYLTENADGLRQDWPRIPLPDSKELLLASAELGKQIAALLDTENDVAASFPSPESPVRTPALQKIAVPTRAGGGQLDDTKDFAVTAGWGHAGKGGVTMPGKGKSTERDYTPEERRSMGDAAIALLGDRTLDIYLNDAAYWANVPVRVWEYTIGGYQVIKKWLSYREEKLLGRPLKKDEVRYVQEMVRRIAAILLLEPALDENYRNVKSQPYPW